MSSQQLNSIMNYSNLMWSAQAHLTFKQIERPKPALHIVGDFVHVSLLQKIYKPVLHTKHSCFYIYNNCFLCAYFDQEHRRNMSCCQLDRKTRMPFLTHWKVASCDNKRLPHQSFKTIQIRYTSKNDIKQHNVNKNLFVQHSNNVLTWTSLHTTCTNSRQQMP